MLFLNTEHKILTSSQVRNRNLKCFVMFCLLPLSFELLMGEYADMVHELLVVPVYIFFYLLLGCIVVAHHALLEELSVKSLHRMHEGLKALPDVAPIFSEAARQGLTLRRRDLLFVLSQHELTLERQSKLNAMNDIRQLSGE